MFDCVFVEKNYLSHYRVQQLLARLKKKPFIINKIEDSFNRVKKPRDLKNTKRHLFLGGKKGQLLKEAEPAYGYRSDEKHYYFIHGYNCIYSCEYCYLQGYFNSPDLVLFVNHEEILVEMEALAAQAKKKAATVWFHGDEFTDSLALAGLDNPWPLYWKFLQANPAVRLELRTKSATVKPLLALPALKNVVVSYSLAPEQKIKQFEPRTPPLTSRLAALAKLAANGFLLGVHLDPIILLDASDEELRQEYHSLLSNLKASLVSVSASKTAWQAALAYLSIGLLRFQKGLYQAVAVNHPQSRLLAGEFRNGFDGKLRYPRPERKRILRLMKELAVELGIEEEKIYFCME